ncbi:Adult-specific rigid cuticular protein 15.7 like protein [Argiope bruennichi]|uniref:Adult-specific rigid cuticular protein 15.7 like protein n=1 Tax=Argiope bruennichi TaxID=94029 RepID=A0A8T0F928_ARGBR|nr:Adult-specific rigid cuticular protein 15.7 like protein [Argiope bruennichi]
MIAKITILFAALAATHASVLLGHGALVSTGVSNRAQTQDAFGNYAFNYGIKDGLGASKLPKLKVGDAPETRREPTPLPTSTDEPDESITSLTDMDPSHRQDQRTRNRRQAPAAALIAVPTPDPSLQSSTT